MALTVFTIFIVLLSLGAPLWLSIILFALNCVIPDTIPFADEFVQGLGVAGKIKQSTGGIKIISWIFKNPIKFILIIIFIVLILQKF
ncbi:MAG: hypothetical protein PSV18_05295 [Methylobacter sp.]|nr:hypothetical protein [Candidatus Methylobacter titanis]